MKLGNADVEQLQLGPETDKNICPLLEQIEFSFCLKGNMSHMEDLIVSRWKVAHNIRPSESLPTYVWERNLWKISLRCCEFEEYSSKKPTLFIKRPSIAKCVEEGLDVFEEPASWHLNLC